MWSLTTCPLRTQRATSRESSKRLSKLNQAVCIGTYMCSYRFFQFRECWNQKLNIYRGTYIKPNFPCQAFFHNLWGKWMARNAGQHKGGQLANETSFPERCAAKQYNNINRDNQWMWLLESNNMFWAKIINPSYDNRGWENQYHLTRPSPEHQITYLGLAVWYWMEGGDWCLITCIHHLGHFYQNCQQC